MRELSHIYFCAIVGCILHLEVDTLKENTCCFAGHRVLSQKKIERIVKRLNKEIDHLIQQGVTNFISGGAVGFDSISSSLVISKKQQG